MVLRRRGLRRNGANPNSYSDMANV